jgi:hypothetical protein
MRAQLQREGEQDEEQAAGSGGRAACALTFVGIQLAGVALQQLGAVFDPPPRVPQPQQPDLHWGGLGGRGTGVRQARAAAAPPAGGRGVQGHGAGSWERPPAPTGSC